MWGWGQREHFMECNMNTYEKNFWRGKISLELNIPELRSNEAEVTWGWGQKEHFVECNLSTFMFLWPHFENFGRGQIKLRSKREFMENDRCIKSEENRLMVFNLKLMAVEAWTCFSLVTTTSLFHVIFYELLRVSQEKSFAKLSFLLAVLPKNPQCSTWF